MAEYDDVIKWKHFPRYWPSVRGIHRSPVNSPHKGQWHGALMFSLICFWINGWWKGLLHIFTVHCNSDLITKVQRWWIVYEEHGYAMSITYIMYMKLFGVINNISHSEVWSPESYIYIILAIIHQVWVCIDCILHGWRDISKFIFRIGYTGDHTI